MNKIVLAQYAKWPKIGKVKTRIGKVWGDEKALAIHLELLIFIMDRFSSNGDFEYILCLDEKVDEALELGVRSQAAGKALSKYIDKKKIDCRKQNGADLGARMCNTFSELAKEYQQVAIIGSDCPNVTQRELQTASQLLNNNDVVIIPAEDGGYVLIAMTAKAIKKVNGNWLSDVTWGSSTALDETLECCRREGLNVHLLAESWDIDEVEDYRRWKAC